MNERDSEAVAAQFIARGFDLAPSEAAADVVLLNTCSVRDSAEQKALGKMRALAAEARRSRPDRVLGFMGCMAQSRGQELLDGIPRLDLVIGTHRFHRAADHVSSILTKGRDRICDIGSDEGAAPAQDHLPPLEKRARKVTAFVTIMHGCNQHCSFCVVPDTRGREQSRPRADIVAECRGLADQGIREVTLLGQTVTSYGRGLSEATNGTSPFVQLLEAVHAVEGIDRIRFTAPHPRGYGEDLAHAYARLPKLCESAHIPLQSGSDRVLQLMRRGYTIERFAGLIGKLRQARPGIGLSTDLIVGFPGETEEDFERTLAAVREIEFDSAFVFKFSPRQNTPAAQMPDQAPIEVREERHACLLRLVHEIGARKYQQLVGRKVRVLVEGKSHKNPARLEGRTGCNKIVVFEGNDRHIGELMDVKIVRASAVTLYGDPAILNLD